MDPIDENMSVMYGKPIRAFPEQDHDSHIAVHMQFLQDPSLGGNPSARGFATNNDAYTLQNISLYYIEQEWNQLLVCQCQSCQTSKILNLNLMM